MNTPNKLSNSTILETVSDSEITKVLHAIISVCGPPIAGLLPVLNNAIASKRYKERIQSDLIEINDLLNTYIEKVEDLEDAQYKVINDSIITMLNTYNEEKLNYLKKVVRNTLFDEEIKTNEAEVISRLIRDISAEEIAFLVDNENVKYFELSNTSQEGEDTYYINLDTHEATILTSLISLGVVVYSHAGWFSANKYQFSNILPKLINLVKS